MPGNLALIENMIPVNGVALYYEEHGGGEPIVCIHGTSSSAAVWADAVEVLATRGRTIVYDRRGCFRSERPEPSVTNVHQQADDAAALIDALAAAPAIVIGRSYGADIAIDLALRYPDRVRALALLEGLESSARVEWIEGGHLINPAHPAVLAFIDEGLDPKEKP
jgi:pimeloyl-ACP methyl ester carboxylesterase